MIMNREPLVIIGGPTASGKSRLAVELARRIGGEVISADSMQIYKGMDIGTAKIMPDEMMGIRHYLVDELQPDDPYNVVIFKDMALRAMKDIIGSGHIPIVAGGTGFYIQALLRDVHFTENDTDMSFREKLQRIANDESSPGKLYGMLQDVDPQSASDIHENNTKRIIRALEFYHQTGQRMSDHNRQEAARLSPYAHAYFVLDMPRQQLYERIERRVDMMMEQGLTDEVRSLREKGYSRDLVSMQGLGYKEIFAYLEGEYSLEEAVEILKRSTRHFAKRQLTWFRREKDAIWLDMNALGSEQAILDRMCDELMKRGIIGNE